MASTMAPQKSKSTKDNSSNKELVSILRKTKKASQSNLKITKTISAINLNKKSNPTYQFNTNQTSVSPGSFENNQDKTSLKQTTVSNIQSSSLATTTTSTKRPQKPRRRVATIAQRRAANIRERRRMFNLNAAFDRLRKKVPSFAYEKRLSRIETLKLAIMYIRFMDDLVNDNAYAEKYKQLTSSMNSNISQHNNSIINLHTIAQSESPNNDNQQNFISQTCTASNCPDYFSSQNSSSYLPLYDQCGNSISRVACLNTQQQQYLLNNKRSKQTQLDNTHIIKNEPIDCHEDCCSLIIDNKNNNLKQQYRLTSQTGVTFLSSSTIVTQSTKSSVTNCDSSLSSSASSSSSSSSSPMSSSTFSIIDSSNSSTIAGTNRHLSIQTTNTNNRTTTTTSLTNGAETRQQENYSSPSLFTQPQQQQYSSPSTYSDHFQDNISILPYYNNCETKYYNDNNSININQSSTKQPSGLTNHCYSNNNRVHNNQESEKSNNIDLTELQLNNNQQLAGLDMPANNHYSLHSLQAR